MSWLLLLLLPASFTVPCADPAFERDCGALGCSECRPAEADDER